MSIPSPFKRNSKNAFAQKTVSTFVPYFGLNQLTVLASLQTPYLDPAAYRGLEQQNTSSSLQITKTISKSFIEKKIIKIGLGLY